MRGVSNTNNHKSDEFKRVLSSSVFVALCWIVFILMFIFVYFFSLFPTATAFPSFFKTITTTSEEGVESSKNYSLGYRGFAYNGDSNEYLKKGSLVLLREYDPLVNPLVVGQPAAYKHETFDKTTGKLISSEFVIRIITSFEVSADYSYATFSSTALDGSDLIELHRARYASIYGPLVTDQYTQIGFVGSVANALAPSIAVGAISLAILLLILVILPLFLAIRLKKHGYGMNNLHEQRRVFAPALITVLSVAIFAVISTLIYYPAFVKTSNFYVHNGTTVKDVVNNGSLYIVSDFNKDSNPLTENTAFIYLVQTKNDKGIVTKTTKEIKICVQSYFHIGEKVDGKYREAYLAVFYKDLDNPDAEHYMELQISNIVGSITSGTTAIPFVGMLSYYLNYNIYISILTLLAFVILLIVLPILFLRKRIIISKRRSPFKEGLNKQELSPEAGFIYQSLRDFFKEGNLHMKKGFGCDMIYTPNNQLFCKIAVENHIVCVFINKNFARFDGSINRSGYIRIPHGAELDTAKDRIFDIYKRYFKKNRQ